MKKSIGMLESEKWGLTSNFRRAQIVEMYEYLSGGNSLSVPFFPARSPAVDFFTASQLGASAPETKGRQKCFS
jgi:hypothetical protein